VLGVGGEEGAPVPLREGGFLQDSKAISSSPAGTAALGELAEEGVECTEN